MVRECDSVVAIRTAPMQMGQGAELEQPWDKAVRDSLPVLDGWRGISILCVLATHMLPLGPYGWGNAFVGIAGMSLFFTLSGFLITSTLLEKDDVRSFFIRRACRILPLAF